MPDPASSAVSRPQSTSPAPATFSRRAATLTVSPMTVKSPARPTEAAITSPELIPIENARSPPSSRIARPAATALSASSSWATGTPKTAMTESPMYLSTVPPCSATTSLSCLNAASTIRATTSGSVLLRERREADHVREQDRRELALLGSSLDAPRPRREGLSAGRQVSQRLRPDRAALPAERLCRTVALTARRADDKGEPLAALAAEPVPVRIPGPARSTGSHRDKA